MQLRTAHFNGTCYTCGSTYAPGEAIAEVEGIRGPRGGMRWQHAWHVSGIETPQAIAPQITAPSPAPIQYGEVEIDVTRDGSEVESFVNALRSKVVGQDDAINAMAQWYRRWKAGLNDTTRPVGNCLLLGLTGTGKTRLVEAMAEVLHGDANRLIKVDCGEYQHSHEIAKLVGSPPGYLGHRETPPRINRAAIEANQSSRNPVTLVLFDEVEKGSDALYKLLLGILDKATIMHGDGKQTVMTDCVIVMTSNLGTRELQRMVSTRFEGKYFANGKVTEKQSQPFEVIAESAINAAKTHFAPEFWNRLDSVTVYRPLTHENLLAIAKIEIAKIAKRMHLSIMPDESAVEFLARKGFSPEFGARYLRRTIETELLDPLTRANISGQLTKAREIHVKGTDTGLKFFAVAPMSA